MKAINQTPRRISALTRSPLTIPILLVLFCSGIGQSQPLNPELKTTPGDVPTLLKNDDGIALYEHWIKLEGFPEGREMVVEFDIQAEWETALELITNEQLAADWMTSIKAFRILSNAGDDTWYSYILYDIPWPLRKQDVVILNRLEKDPLGNKVCITMHAAPGYQPENKGVTRINHMIGTWQLCSVSEDRTRVRYSVYSGQRSSFPRWITDPIIQGNLVRTMKNFREAAEKTSERIHLCTQSGS